MKRIIMAILLILSLCLSLFGCQSISNNTTPPNPSESESNSVSESNSNTKVDYTETLDIADDYSIIKESGKTYIVFDNISKYSKSDSDHIGIQYDSIDQFVSKVLEKKMSSYEKEQLIDCNDILDNNKVEICNLDSIYKINNMPNDFACMDEIIWFGKGYIISALQKSQSNDTIVVECYMGTDSFLENCYEAFPVVDNITPQLVRKENIDNHEIDVSYYADGIISYSIESETKKFEIFETKLNTAYTKVESIAEIYPQQISVICTENNITYHLIIRSSENQSNNIFRPTPDWFLSWGIEKYIPQ